MNGVVIVDKPKGKTSHDVVAALRRVYKTRRVGHTGTLDPLADGVLPVCVGNATKAADMLTSADKSYTAVLELGKRTDTLDIEGSLLEQRPVDVTEEEIRAVIGEFKGEQYQLPPMYSAIKQNGRKLYELAREGKEVERTPRKINIYSLDILKIELPYIKIDVRCSKGTYIRSLCDDIGRRLGCGAVMTELRRTEAAGFKISQAYTLEQLNEMEEPEAALIPTDSLFAQLPQIRLNEKQERSIINGVRMTWRGGAEGQRYRLYGANGSFLCVSEIREQRLVLIKSFWN
ncbi:MAG: tRNA pseudouridine(55) synthase TruB [Clostridiales bacterium]|nr:tRNA pseudouridine(55) synthase TruB [Clostridiales bacterium]